MKGVKLYLVQKIFDRAKKTYDLNSDKTLFKDRWVFITPDWKVYDKNGNPTKISYLKSTMLYAPSYYDFQMFKNYSHDLRMVGEFREGRCNSFSCERMLSPATVDILKEVGFDMTTSMLSTWQFKSGFCCYDIPEDSYLTEWFVENLIHPNRVARRKKENSLIKHDYKYYHDLMGNKEHAREQMKKSGFPRLRGRRTSLRCPEIPPRLFFSRSSPRSLRNNRLLSEDA